MLTAFAFQDDKNTGVYQMNTYEIIQNAIGASGFTTDDTAAGYVNPSYWNRQVLAFLEERLVVADKAKVYNDLLGQDGASLAVTVDVAPTAAAAVAETAAGARPWRRPSSDHRRQSCGN